MNMIVGFYLVMVSIMPNGEVVGETLDYFDNPYDPRDSSSRPIPGNPRDPNDPSSYL